MTFYFSLWALTETRQCIHSTSQASDILVRTTDLEITDRAQSHGFSRLQFVLDVKTVAMVGGHGDWGERWNSTTNQHDNPGMLVAEQTKYRKHEFNMHKLDIALLLLCALLLARWDHPLYGIFGPWLC